MKLDTLEIYIQKKILLALIPEKSISFVQKPLHKIQETYLHEVQLVSDTESTIKS